MHLDKRKNILITGVPGVGKTTLIKKIAGTLRSHHPVGFFTEEIRMGGIRKGFELVSLDGRRGILAHIDFKSPYQVGRYRVDIKGFETFLATIPFSHPSVSIIIMDEIGKMECFSEKFKEVLLKCLDAEKRVIGTIALKGSGFIEEIKRRQDTILFEMTSKNRDFLLTEILEEVERNVREED